MRLNHGVETGVELRRVGRDLGRFELHSVTGKRHALELTVRVMGVGPGLEKLAVIYRSRRLDSCRGLTRTTQYTADDDAQSVGTDTKESGTYHSDY